MRIPLVAAALVLASCDSFPVMVEPRLQVSPYLAVYRLRGDVAMQSNPGPQDNAPQDLSNFGVGSYKEDVGVRVDLGDEFAGFRVDYYRLDQSTSQRGILTDDWGDMDAGDDANMSVTMDELRIGWMQEVLSHRGQWRDGEVRLRLGLGLTYAYRGMKMRAEDFSSGRTQNLEIDGNLFYPAARFRAGWESVMVDLDYAISPDIALSGDWGDVQQDIEARLNYRVPFQDVTFFAGYRYSILMADGTQDGFGYDADLRLDGFQFGVTVSF